MKTHSKLVGREVDQGFTILEILVAIALLGILTAVLSTTLVGSLNLNRQSQRQLDTTSSVQGIMENIRNGWNETGRYDSACVPGLSLPPGYTARFSNLNSRAEALLLDGTVVTGTTVIPQYPVEVVAASATCGTQSGDSLTSTPATVPTMRRVTVQSGTGNPQVIGPQDVALTLDILRPQ